jgi:hypothetical protein
MARGKRRGPGEVTRRRKVRGRIEVRSRREQDETESRRVEDRSHREASWQLQEDSH